MASEAEARIRVKAEKLLRDCFPDARIVHEFELGGVRLDLAAITPSRLILLEIKSELDTLSRLAKQVKCARAIGGPVMVCFAPKWAAGVREVCSAHGLWGVEWLEETEEGFSGLVPTRFTPNHDRYDSRMLLQMLLKPELLALAKAFGGKPRNTVPELHHLAHENMTGREVRLAVMSALRARRFGWTCDAPMEQAA